MTLARNLHNPLPEMYFDSGPAIHVLSGYVLDELSNDRVRGKVFGRTTRDERPVLRSPGGIYSYASVRRSDGQVCAGQSVPTLEPVYYASSEISLHVGNHPLLVHMAGRQFERPQMSEPFFFSAAPAAVALDDTTPFVGCYRVPPGALLVNRPGTCAVKLRSAPRPFYGRFRTKTYQQRVASASEALAEAGSILKRLPEGEFRVSGGKDSRLLAAYLIREGIGSVPVNQNLPEEVEGQVADLVARELGADACVRVPFEDMIDLDDIVGGTMRKIAFSGGLPSYAALQYPNHHEGINPGSPVIMGHAHLQRGGLPHRIRRAQDAMTVAASRTTSPLLGLDFVEANLRRVRACVDEELARPRALPQRVGFLIYLQYTLNYQFQSHYAYMRNWHHLVTPLVDERFTALCEQISIEPPSWAPGELPGIMDLRGERIAMGLTEALGPSLLEFPLASSRYLCDTPNTPNYHKRDPDSIVPMPIPPEKVRPFNTRITNTPTRSLIWNTIEDTVVGSLAEHACLPDIWGYITNPESSVPNGANRTGVNQFLWSLFGFSLILESKWWERLDT